MVDGKRTQPNVSSFPYNLLPSLSQENVHHQHWGSFLSGPKSSCGCCCRLFVGHRKSRLQEASCRVGRAAVWVQNLVWQFVEYHLWSSSKSAHYSKKHAGVLTNSKESYRIKHKLTKHDSLKIALFIHILHGKQLVQIKNFALSTVSLLKCNDFNPIYLSVFQNKPLESPNTRAPSKPWLTQLFSSVIMLEQSDPLAAVSINSHT